MSWRRSPRPRGTSSPCEPRLKPGHAIASLALTVAIAAALDAAAPAVEILTSIAAMPPHLAGKLREPYGCAQASTGEYVVLDRRGHSVFVINAGRTEMRQVLSIGQELGRLLEPGVLSLAGNDIFAIADGPGGYERIQYFGLDGTRVGGFYLPRRTGARYTVGSVMINGVSSMTFTGRTFLINQPQSGALISELSLEGNVVRSIGAFRKTGYESEPVLHAALNIGLPLADPSGGFYFVFQTGVPLLRRYDAAGTLLFERHIEGPQLDAAIQAIPTTWPTRPAGSASVPLVPTLVRTAAVDRSGRVWISLGEPFTYVYDRTGERIRTVQFRGAGVVEPTSFFFTPDNRILITPGCYEFAG